MFFTSLCRQKEFDTRPKEVGLKDAGVSWCGGGDHNNVVVVVVVVVVLSAVGAARARETAPVCFWHRRFSDRVVHDRRDIGQQGSVVDPLGSVVRGLTESLS